MNPHDQWDWNAFKNIWPLGFVLLDIFYYIFKFHIYLIGQIHKIMDSRLSLQSHKLSSILKIKIQRDDSNRVKHLTLLLDLYSSHHSHYPIPACTYAERGNAPSMQVQNSVRLIYTQGPAKIRVQRHAGLSWSLLHQWLVQSSDLVFSLETTTPPFKG